MQKNIIDFYSKFSQKYNRHPNRTDMSKGGFDRDTVRRHFGSQSNLRAVVKKLKPESFQTVFDEDLFTEKTFKKLQSEVQKYKRFVVTTAVNGCKVHKGFMKSIQKYCEVNNATLLIIPSHDPAHNLDNKYSWNFDPTLIDNLIVFNDLALNKNLHISSVHIAAKQIDPTTGFDRFGQRDGSFIFASPKQRMKVVPVGGNKLPHVLMTTGALTDSNYSSTRFMSQRTAFMAANDHVLGALVVEIQDDTYFHYRQVQANKQGAFIDLGTMYAGDKISKINPEAIVLGDWHSGDTDPVTKETWFEVIKELNPETVIVHDIFSANSISHHDSNKLLNKARKANRGLLDLENELRNAALDLNEICKVSKHVVIVKSNHDEHLERYLQEGRYQDEPHNMTLGLKLALAVVNGHDPLKWALEKEIELLEQPTKIKWLERDESFKIAKIELGMHGDIGANGAKGSIVSAEKSYGACVIGHSHTPQILRQAWGVGTSTYLDLDYNRGASSWLNTSCLVYPNGSRQLINVIDGKWRM